MSHDLLEESVLLSLRRRHLLEGLRVEEDWFEECEDLVLSLSPQLKRLEKILLRVSFEEGCGGLGYSFGKLTLEQGSIAVLNLNKTSQVVGLVLH